jgi:ribonuclease R
VTVELELEDARVVRSSFYRSLIRSDERLDYERVDRVFAGREKAAAPWGESLGAARDAAAALARRREQRGGLVIDGEEPEFEFDEHGNVRDVHARAQTESHSLIEHLMIAANEAVAELLEQRAIPCLYRVHERPDPQRIERLVAQLASLEVPTPPVPEPLAPAQAADLLSEISRLVERHVRRAGRGAIALESLVLRSLKQAYYSPRNLGHAGLHSPRYCHFTSPIRRYPDVVCHRALLSTVGGGEHAPRASALGELGEWTSERERDAARTERDADDIARCFVLERVLYDAGPEHVFAGEISGLIGAGAFVAFGEGGAREGSTERSATAFEGMLSVRVLRAPAKQRPPQRERPRGGRRSGASVEQAGGREWWELNEEGTILRGERTGASVRLGDAVKVRVTSVDTPRGRVDLAPAG